MSIKTKKQMILSIFDEYGLKEVDKQAIELINDKLCIYLGKRGKTSVNYIIDVLKKHGKNVTYTPSYAAKTDYDNDFKNILKFKTVDQAVQSIKKIDKLYRMYKHKNDKKGMQMCEWYALKGWQMCMAISMKKNVDEKIKTEKRKISDYFLKWYNNHDI